MTQFEVNVGIFVGLFMLFVAAKDVSPKVNEALKVMVRYEKAYLAVMGIIHGLTNLGGSLLTAIVHSKEYEKNVTRVTVAVAYATFAVFQILTLLGSGYSVTSRLSEIGIYVAVGISIFIITEKLIFMDLKTQSYSRYLLFFCFSRNHAVRAVFLRSYKINLSISGVSNHQSSESSPRAPKRLSLRANFSWTFMETLSILRAGLG